MPEDDQRLARMDSMMSDIYRWLQGDPAFKEVGLIEQFKTFRQEVYERLEKVEQTARRNSWTIIGFAVGFGVAAVVFGVLTLQQLKDIIK